MLRAAFLPWPVAMVTERSAGTMSPPAKMPGRPVIMSGPTMTVPSSLKAMSGTERRKPELRLLPEREHDGVGFQRLELAGRLGASVLADLHALDREVAAVDLP